MPWTILRDANAWSNYVERMSRDLALVGTYVDWSKSPALYPCLADSVRTGTTSQATAFVYPEDARVLLMFSEEPAGRQEDCGEGPTVSESLKALAAHDLAVAAILVNSGLCTEKQYEQTYVQHLAWIDQASAQDREKIRRGEYKLPGFSVPPRE